ncbi:MAG: O-antigen ligase family protein [Patescibacteria group bacterium]|nr:O-antigen ligase family protein [Patescibacteria group bacterium]
MSLAVTNLFDRRFWLCLAIFFAFNLISFLGFHVLIVQVVFFWLLVFLMICLVIWRFDFAILLFLGELLFGQAGHFLEWQNISLRSALMIILLIGWLTRKIVKQEKILFFQQSISVYCLVLALMVLLAVGRGFWNNHESLLVIQDAMAYGFFLLVFPLSEFFRKESYWPWLTRILAVAVIGVSILTLANLFIYSAGLSQVHDNYYWWLRQIAVGKVTDLGSGFYRIVFPAHLWMLPLLLVLLSLVLGRNVSRGERKNLIILAVAISLSLMINFSRGYFLGILAGLMLLKLNLSWRRWLIAFILILLVFVVEFNLIYFLTTGKLAGLTFLSGRLGTITQPEEELSSLTRLRILPNLLFQIKQNPIFGPGLGSMVSFLNPLNNLITKTSNPDWGWLEMWLELGLLGLMVYLAFSGKLIFSYLKGASRFSRDLSVGLAVGFVSLMVANLTGPFLFHPLGIFYQVLMISFI